MRKISIGMYHACADYPGIVLLYIRPITANESTYANALDVVLGEANDVK